MDRRDRVLDRSALEQQIELLRDLRVLVKRLLRVALPVLQDTQVGVGALYPLAPQADVLDRRYDPAEQPLLEPRVHLRRVVLAHRLLGVEVELLPELFGVE